MFGLEPGKLRRLNEVSIVPSYEKYVFVRGILFCIVFTTWSSQKRQIKQKQRKRKAKQNASQTTNY